MDSDYDEDDEDDFEDDDIKEIPPQKQMEALKQRMDELQTKWDALEGDRESISRLTLDELRALKLVKQNEVKLVEEAEQRLMDITLKCVACTVRNKNISFIDGCGHIAFCGECEAKAKGNLCPICKAPHTKTKKINL